MVEAIFSRKCAASNTPICHFRGSGSLEDKNIYFWIPDQAGNDKVAGFRKRFYAKYYSSHRHEFILCFGGAAGQSFFAW